MLIASGRQKVKKVIFSYARDFRYKQPAFLMETGDVVIAAIMAEVAGGRDAARFAAGGSR